jgi:hypothetical protein
LNEAVETGIAFTTPLSSGNAYTEFFVALGPPYGRMVLSHVVERGYMRTESASRTILRLQFDFAKSLKRDKRALPDPYEHL